LGLGIERAVGEVASRFVNRRGRILSGSDPEHTAVLALLTACRHPAIAVSIASTNFPDEQFGATVLLYVVMNFTLCIPYILWQRSRVRRAGMRIVPGADSPQFQTPRGHMNPPRIEPAASGAAANTWAGRNLLNSVMLRMLIGAIVFTEGCASLGMSDPASLLVPRLHRSEIVGIVAGFGTTFAGLPDLLTMFKQRSNASINPRMAGIMAVFQVLWVYYGLLIASRPVIVWNVLGIAINSIIVWSYVRFDEVGRRQAPKRPQGSGAEAR
jgi:uncharacterized protein with PQ loop repeat